jgi:hypothetical protein
MRDYILPQFHVYPGCILVDSDDTVSEGDYIHTNAGWKPVHRGDAAIGLLVGQCRVARPYMNVKMDWNVRAKGKGDPTLGRRTRGWTPFKIL